MGRPRTQHPKCPQICVHVPMYVLQHVRELSKRTDCSLAYLVLKGLQAIGVEIKPEDLLKDRRRTRPKATRQHYAQKPERGNTGKTRRPDG